MTGADLRPERPERALMIPKLARVLLSFTLAGLAAEGSEREAFAYYPFPGYVEAHLDVTTLPADPPGQGCELCHNNPAGGLGTATQPFGMLIKAQGILYTSSEAELDAALDAIKANPATTRYITDIEMDVNPNTDPALQATASSDTITPAYGCGATIAGRGLSRAPGANPFLLAGLLGLALGIRRTKARSKRLSRDRRSLLP
jgi:hypothetical protein